MINLIIKVVKFLSAIYKSQIETAEIFIEIAKSTLVRANLKLEKITLEKNINSNNVKSVKFYDELIKLE
jgi:CRISPR/Cas system-associated endonuclease Cas3-HD